MLKEKKNFLNNILFIIIVLLMFLQIVERFTFLGYFKDIMTVLYAVTLPILMIIYGIKLRESEEPVENIFKKGFLFYFVLQIINTIIYANKIEDNPGYFLFTPYFIDWIFIAIPIYTLIMQKLGKENHILFTTTIIALCLTVDGSINSDLICKIIMYLPFFVLGWKYEKEVEKLPKGKIFSFLKILAIVALVFAFRIIDTKDVMISTVRTEQDAVQIMVLKLMLYAVSAIVFSVLLDIFGKSKVLNKEYEITGWKNVLRVIVILPILNFYYMQKDNIVNQINSSYYLWAIAAVEITATIAIAIIPFEKCFMSIVNKIKDIEEKRKERKIEKLKKKNKYEPERLISPPDGILTRFVNSNIILIVLGIIMLLKLLMFYHHTVFTANNISQTAIWYNVAFTLLFLVPLLVINNNRIRFIGILIWDLAISAILFADEVYFSYSSMAISVNQAGNIRYAREILDTIRYLLNARQILYFIDILVFLLILRFVKFKNIKKGTRDRNYKNVIASLLIIYMCTANVQSLVRFAYNAPYNNRYQISESTIFGYHLNDIRTFFNVKKSLKYKTQDAVEDAYLKLKEYQDENFTEKYTGIAKGKNVIVLQLESIQEFLYKAKINGKEVTPNLNKFLDENIHLTNMHSQSYSSTADSEFAVQMSLYPLENGLSFSKYYDVEYDDLFSIMTENDYYTSYIHGNDDRFWNRRKVYSNFDVNELNFIDSFDDKSEIIMNYLSDELLYKQTIEKLESYKEPFFANILSASSHTGFTLDGLSDEKREKIINIDVGDYKGTVIGNYLESARYADEEFGMFINKLKKDGLYDDSVIIVFGDHYGVRADEWSLYDYLDKQMDIQLNDVQKRINFTNVLAGVHIPGMKHKVINKPISKLDIKPTVLSLVGIEDIDDMSLGVSFFSNKDYASTNENTIIAQDLYYDSMKWYDIKSGEEVNMDELSEEERESLDKKVEYLQIELDISSAVPVLYKMDSEEVLKKANIKK